MHFIVDGNNVAWAAFHALGRAMGAETPEQKARATLLGLTQSIIGMVTPGNPATVDFGEGEVVSGLVVAFDQGRPHRRRSLYPAYQTGREGQSSFMDNEPFVLEGIRQFSDAASNMPITILRGENTEADDLIAAATLTLDPTAVRIASSDRDFLQLVNERVSIFSFVKKAVIDDRGFDVAVLPATKDGEPISFPRERFVDFRALCGDSSDDLPGLPGIGPLTAARLLAYRPLDDYFTNPSLVPTAMGKASRKIEAAFYDTAAREIVERNRALMDLKLGAAFYSDLTSVSSEGRWDRDAVESWLKEQRIARVNLKATLETFERLANFGPVSFG
jgi:DNA polymerase I